MLGADVNRIGFDDARAMFLCVLDGGLDEQVGQPTAAIRLGDEEAHDGPDWPIVNRLQRR